VTAAAGAGSASQSAVVVQENYPQLEEYVQESQDEYYEGE
jgi:hypothetical protein